MSDAKELIKRVREIALDIGREETGVFLVNAGIPFGTVEKLVSGRYTCTPKEKLHRRLKLALDAFNSAKLKTPK